MGESWGETLACMHTLCNPLRGAYLYGETLLIHHKLTRTNSLGSMRRNPFLRDRHGKPVRRFVASYSYSIVQSHEASTRETRSPHRMNNRRRIRTERQALTTTRTAPLHCITASWNDPGMDSILFLSHRSNDTGCALHSQKLPATARPLCFHSFWLRSLHAGVRVET